MDECRSTAAPGRRRSCSGDRSGSRRPPRTAATLSARGRRQGQRQGPLRPAAVLRSRRRSTRTPSTLTRSPTPVIEPGRVYVTFGSPGTAAIDTATGKVIWERRDLECNHYRGAGSSPILFGNLLHHAFRRQRRAVPRRAGQGDRQDGVEDASVRSTSRTSAPDGKLQAEGDFRKGFATPHVIMAGGRPVLVSLGLQGGLRLRSARPARSCGGSRIAARTRRARGRSRATGWCSIRRAGRRAAGRLEAGRARRCRRDARRVARHAGGPEQAVAAPGRRYHLDGERRRHRQLPRSARPAQASGSRGSRGNTPPRRCSRRARIYFFSEDGKTTVIEAGRAFKVLAENQLGDGFMASPAVDGNALILRSRTHLYRIE